MIPAILHYVWVGGSLPKLQQDFIDTWRAYNPDWEIMAWNESNIDMSSAIIRDAYKNKKWAKVADIARLQAVAKMGGIYLDTDFRVFKPLDCLRQYKCFFVFQEDAPSPDWVCNGAFGAEPDHWFVRHVLAELYKKKPSPFIPEQPTSFGPKHVTKLLAQAGLPPRYEPNGSSVNDINVLPMAWFFPFRADEVFTPACVKDDTLAGHFWAKSWEKTIPMPIRIARDVRNSLRRQIRHLRAS